MEYAGKKKVLQSNDQKFIDDFNNVKGFEVWTAYTAEFFRVRKSQVWKMAKLTRLRYYLSNEVYENRRTVMVIH